MQGTIISLEKQDAPVSDPRRALGDKILVKIRPDGDMGYIALQYPWEMAEAFTLGKRVEITVSEVR